MVYDKLQLIPSSDMEIQYITVKGGDNALSGKDAFYEIVIQETGCYYIELDAGHNGFNYEIYEYNMYNGDYRILSSGIDEISINTNLYLKSVEDFEDLYSAKKYFLRVDFGRDSTWDKYINAIVLFGHKYLYENHSDTHHKAYCSCGEFIYEQHEIDGDRCVLCNEPHTHEYSYESISNTHHEAYCSCGESVEGLHMFHNGTCPLCGFEHIHEYTGWKYYSNTKHVECCNICGETGAVKKNHVVSSSGVGLLKECLMCGAMVSISGNIGQIDSVTIMVSENGSYITPDGIIVLVDDDVDAYFGGTLVFYNPNDNLEKV